jgi:hypothetical protein
MERQTRKPETAITPNRRIWRGVSVAFVIETILLVFFIFLLVQYARCEEPGSSTGRASIIMKAPDARLFDFSTWYMIGGFAADYFSSQWLDKNKFREGNPVMDLGPYGQAGLLAGSCAMAIAAKKTLIESGHPKAARIMSYAVGSIHYGAAGWNIQLRLRL